MSRILVLQNEHHLGDHIINFIFFYKIKDYIEENNIIIHYHCLEKYHNNLAEFNCSKNIIIKDWENIGYVLWQETFPNPYNYIEGKLCRMFNIFLKYADIPLLVNSFEYQDPELFTRSEKLDDKYKNIDNEIFNYSIKPNKTDLPIVNAPAHLLLNGAPLRLSERHLL